MCESSAGLKRARKKRARETTPIYGFISFCCNQKYFHWLNNNKWSDVGAAAADQHHLLLNTHFFFIHNFVAFRSGSRGFHDFNRCIFCAVVVGPSFINGNAEKNVINYFLLCVHFPAYYLAAMVKVTTLYSLKNVHTNCQRHCPICYSRDIVPGSRYFNAVFSNSSRFAHNWRRPLNNYDGFFIQLCSRFICTAQILPREVRIFQ